MFHFVQQQMSQIEWSKVIDAKLHLKVLLCSIIWGHENPSIIDQGMQWQIAFLKSLGEVANGTACNIES